METIQKKKAWHDIPIKGRYRLIYRVGNSQGPSAFGGYHLPVFPNPWTGQKTFLKNADGKPMNGYMIDRIAKILNPDENVNDNYLVSWLITHPEVNLEGFKDVPEEILSKKRTSKITLVAMETNELDKFEEQDYIDKVIGMLSLDMGTHAVSLKKLRYIMAFLGMTYMDTRYEGKGEKSALRNKLKSYARSSYENAENVNRALENIKDAQDIYEFKELVRLKIITMEHGVYKFQNAPLGTGFDSVNKFFVNHPEVKTEALARLYK